MKVFRVEDKYGLGYKNYLDGVIQNWTDMGFVGTYLADEEEYFKRRPMPNNDRIPSTRIRKYHLFGFKSIEQLNRWFLPADLVLGNYIGGVIAVYNVSSRCIIEGNKQLVFDKRKAKLIEKLDMSHFLSDEQKSSLYDFKEMAIENKELNMEMVPELNFLYEE